MNEMMKKWIAALRSGEFKQGTAVLCDKDHRYCCLGVAAVVLGAEFVQNEGYGDCFVIPDSDGDTGTDWRSGELPSTMRDELGITAKEQRELIELNDSYRESFTFIANWLEARHG